MNLNELYDIALDMLSVKKSNGFGFNINNSKVTVISTDDGSIFKATNGSTIENGHLKDTCSEFEAITLMMKEHKTLIDYLITLDMETGEFCIPCDNCLELMLQINPKNSNAKIMTNVHEYTELNKLTSNDTVLTNTSSPSVDIDDWSEGWDSGSISMDSDISPINDVEPIKNNKNVSRPVSIFEDNPIPSKPDKIVQKAKSSYYQSRYSNSIPAPIDVSMNIDSVQNKNTTFKQQNNDITDKLREKGLSETDKKDFNKQRLFDAFTFENVTNVNGMESSEIYIDVANKQTLTKKELLKIAKEKKKMAKKDAKILKNANKKR